MCELNWFIKQKMRKYITSRNVFKSATRLILGFVILNILINLSKRLSSQEFLELADILWQGNATVRYQNPDNWTIY